MELEHWVTIAVAANIAVIILFAVQRAAYFERFESAQAERAERDAEERVRITVR